MTWVPWRPRGAQVDADAERVAAWEWTDPPARGKAVRVGKALLLLVALAVSVVLNDTAGTWMGDLRPTPKLCRRVRRLRHGGRVAMIVWVAGDGADVPQGPSAAKLGADLSLSIYDPQQILDLTDSTLDTLGPWRGPRNRFKTLPATHLAASLTTRSGPVTVIGEPYDIAVMAVLAGWAAPPHEPESGT